MVQYIPPPNPRELLPPLLACLPTAFFSPRPPPALLPLLTPVLRQRVQLHATSTSTTSKSDSWLPLLNWNAERAAKLPEVVESLQIEPHPVSGEIELPDVEKIDYRRLDSETLHVRFQVEEYGLLPIYLWCLGDGQGQEMGWKLAELRSLEDLEDGMEWFKNIDDANEQAGSERSAQSHANGVNGTHGSDGAEKDSTEDDDQGYWAAYDQTPGRTPMKRSPAPPQTSNVQLPTNTELEYFSRYMSEVQPAMDPHDPSEEGLAPGESTLDGTAFTPTVRRPQTDPMETSNIGHFGYDSSLPPPLAPITKGAETSEGVLHSPRPSSSRSDKSVEQLEKRAMSSSQAEVGIKQHISTDIKSLFRLARSAGIDRDEFERIVKTELDCLSLMELE